MYEELVKRLIHDTELLSQDGWAAGLFTDAADAIEELSREYESIAKSLTESVELVRKLQQTVEHYKGCSDDWYKEACDYKAMLPRWIPVTEQKPPLPEDEDVCYVQVIGAVKGRKEAEPVLYSRAYRLRDGKRVRIERFVGDGEVLEVTHWMLMPEPPEPPKEEA